MVREGRAREGDARRQPDSFEIRIRFLWQSWPMMLRVCLCSLSLSLTASTTDRCSRKPTSAVIVQHNCFGSTWLSFLLDSLQ